MRVVEGRDIVPRRWFREEAFFRFPTRANDEAQQRRTVVAGLLRVGASRERFALDDDRSQRPPRGFRDGGEEANERLRGSHAADVHEDAPRAAEVAGEMRRVLERVDAREPDVRVVPRRRVHELLRDVEAQDRARVPRGARHERGGVAVRAPDVHDALAGAGDEPREAAKRLRGRHEEDARGGVARVGGGRIGNGVGGDAREPAGRALQDAVEREPVEGGGRGRDRPALLRGGGRGGGRGRHAARLGARDRD